MKYENPRQVITLHLPKDPVRCFNYALQYCAKIVEDFGYIHGDETPEMCVFAEIEMGKVLKKILNSRI